MIELKFHSPRKVTDQAAEVLRKAKAQVFGDERVSFVPSAPGTDVLHLDVDALQTYPLAERYLIGRMKQLTGRELPLIPWDDDPETVLYFDIETHSEEDRWKMSPREFFRLGQYAWGPTGDVVLTSDYDEILHVIRTANGVIGHNIHSFDLSVLFQSTEPLTMADQYKVFDTFTYAPLVLPVPESYVERSGRRRIDASKPGNAFVWYSLDNLCFQLGLDGKVGDLKALAKKYGGFGSIPVDDPEYREYARNDVIALQQLTTRLLNIKLPDEYDWREQLNAAIDAQNSRNGIRVDIPAATKRRDELAARKEEVLTNLRVQYGFPTQGLQPWKSTAGKQAILTALADADITPETHPEWEKTKTGNISLGGDVLKSLTEGTEIEELGIALAELMGQRSLSQLALDCVQPDGKAHPQITALQRSGRKSTTEPGLTVWSSRGEKAIEKDYFIADTDDEVMVTFDYSQADARIVAAYSGDTEFAKRFAPGSDAHEITGRVVFGDEEYDANMPEGWLEKPELRTKNPLRQTSKNLGHAYSYRAGAKKLSWMAKQPLEVAELFVQKMTEAYPGVTKWQDQVTREGAGGFVINDWGRLIAVEPQHAYTQAPAMYGQSGTRELMVDALIRMLRYDPRIITWLRAQIHDELLFSIPKREVETMVPKIRELMECSWGPSDGSGQVIDFPVGTGGPGRTWMAACH